MKSKPSISNGYDIQPKYVAMALIVFGELSKIQYSNNMELMSQWEGTHKANAKRVIEAYTKHCFVDVNVVLEVVRKLLQCGLYRANNAKNEAGLILASLVPLLRNTDEGYGISVLKDDDVLNTVSSYIFNAIYEYNSLPKDVDAFSYALSVRDYSSLRTELVESVRSKVAASETLTQQNRIMYVNVTDQLIKRLIEVMDYRYYGGVTDNRLNVTYVTKEVLQLEDNVSGNVVDMITSMVAPEPHGGLPRPKLMGYAKIA